MITEQITYTLAGLINMYENYLEDYSSNTAAYWIRELAFVLTGQQMEADLMGFLNRNLQQSVSVVWAVAELNMQPRQTDAKTIQPVLCLMAVIYIQQQHKQQELMKNTRGEIATLSRSMHSMCMCWEMSVMYSPSKGPLLIRHTQSIQCHTDT